MFVGSHISIRKGYTEAARTAAAIGANAYQYFPKNPRSLTVKDFNRKDADACAAFCSEHGLVSIAHTPYPTNLAAEDPHMKKVVEASLHNDLEIAEACGSLGIVVHFGHSKQTDPLKGYMDILASLNRVLHNWRGRTKVLLENQAGERITGHPADGRPPMGTTLLELTQIRNLSDYPEAIGFCLDTCHFFAAGSWNGSNWSDVEKHGEEIGFWNSLEAVHLNDSVFPTGSGRDRHANIGQGHIGESGFLPFLRSEFIRRVPLLLETGSGRDGTHKEEIAYVRQLCKQSDETDAYI